MKISRRNKFIALTAIFGSLIFCLFYFVFIPGNSDPLNNSVSKNYPFLNAHDTVDYVGKETCKGCHADIYHTFVETGMGRSFHTAERKYSAADFEGVKPVFDAKNNFYYYPFWRNSELFIQEFRLSNSSGDTVHNRIEKITHIIGSGQHTNSHFWTDGKHLYQAPLTFYTQERKWDLPPGFEHFNSRFSRKIDIECMSCHTGMPKVTKGSTNIFERLPLGIDCERCHGPGELHVNQKRAGIIVDTSKSADYSIVNPKRLPYQLQVDICQRCHLQGNNVLKRGKQFTDFIPGMHLDSIFTVFMPKTEKGSAFVMAGQAERFQQSACFLGSNKNIKAYNPQLNSTCINCHNPHVSVKNTRIQQFNQTCFNCHHENSKRSKLRHCKSSMGAAGSNCVKCHMPASNTRDIPHVTVHDHKIQRPVAQMIFSGDAYKAENSKANRSNSKSNSGTLSTTTNNSVSDISSGQLHSINAKHPNAFTQLYAYISYFEKFEANPKSLEMANVIWGNWEKQPQDFCYNIGSSAYWEAAVYLNFVKRDFTGIIGLLEGMGIDPNEEHPEISDYFDTPAFWELGRANPLQDIQDPWFFYRIANAFKNNHQPTKALEWYKKLHEIQPLNTDFNAEFAANLIANSQLTEAETLLNIEINRQPKHEECNYQFALVKFAKGDYESARNAIKLCIQLNPDRPEFHELIAQLYELQGNSSMQQKHSTIAQELKLGKK